MLPCLTSRSSHLASAARRDSVLISTSFSAENCMAQIPNSFFENVSRRSRTSLNAAGSCAFSTVVSNTRVPRSTRREKLLSVFGFSGTPVYSWSSWYSSSAANIFASWSWASADRVAVFLTWRFSFGTSSISTDILPSWLYERA